MKLTKTDIRMIMDDFKDEPDLKETKLRLLAAYFQLTAPKLGIAPGGNVVEDLMEWADDAHLEECEVCRAAEEDGIESFFGGTDTEDE